MVIAGLGFYASGGGPTIVEITGETLAVSVSEDLVVAQVVDDLVVAQVVASPLTVVVEQ